MENVFMKITPVVSDKELKKQDRRIVKSYNKTAKKMGKTTQSTLQKSVQNGIEKGSKKAKVNVKPNVTGAGATTSGGGGAGKKIKGGKLGLLGSMGGAKGGWMVVAMAAIATILSSLKTEKAQNTMETVKNQGVAIGKAGNALDLDPAELKGAIDDLRKQGLSFEEALEFSANIANERQKALGGFESILSRDTADADSLSNTINNVFKKLDSKNGVERNAIAEAVGLDIGTASKLRGKRLSGAIDNRGGKFTKQALDFEKASEKQKVAFENKFTSDGKMIDKAFALQVKTKELDNKDTVRQLNTFTSGAQQINNSITELMNEVKGSASNLSSILGTVSSTLVSGFKEISNFIGSFKSLLSGGGWFGGGK